MCLSSVEIMAGKLDGESLGVITQNSFLEEFFSGEAIPELPKSFTLYHYNGIARSCPDNKVLTITGLPALVPIVRYLLQRDCPL